MGGFGGSGGVAGDPFPLFTAAPSGGNADMFPTGVPVEGFVFDDRDAFNDMPCTWDERDGKSDKPPELLPMES